jgi:hypothetical protein
MNTPLNISQGRRFAQAALKSCGSLEQRLDLGTCPTFISSNAEIAACRTSMKHTKSLEWRCRRVVLQRFKRATIERPATIQSSNQEWFLEEFQRLFYCVNCFNANSLRAACRVIKKSTTKVAKEFYVGRSAVPNE